MLPVLFLFFFIIRFPTLVKHTLSDYIKARVGVRLKIPLR